MINGKDKQEEHRRSMDVEREELQQATRHFIRSMMRIGVRVALLPVNRLSREPQQHFQAASREFTLGVATLVHKFAEGLEEMAKDANTSTSFGKGPHTDEELE